MTNEKKLEAAKKARVEKLLEKRKLEMIKMTKIEVPSAVTAVIDSDSDIQVMTEEILDHGLLSPISVVGPYDDGTYKVVEGSRRIKALRTFLKGNKVPCYVVSGAAPDKQLQVLALAANKCHRKSDAALNLKYAEIIFEEVIDDKIPEREATGTLSKMTGISSRMARSYMNIAKKGSEEVRDAVASKDISVDLGVAIAANYDEDQQNRILDVVKNAPKSGRKSGATDLVRRARNGELDSQDTTELAKTVASTFDDREKQSRASDVEKHIRRAEESLRFLLSLDPKPDNRLMANLVALCKQTCEGYRA